MVGTSRSGGGRPITRRAPLAGSQAALAGAGARRPRGLGNSGHRCGTGNFRGSATSAHRASGGTTGRESLSATTKRYFGCSGM